MKKEHPKADIPPIVKETAESRRHADHGGMCLSVLLSVSVAVAKLVQKIVCLFVCLCVGGNRVLTTRNKSILFCIDL